MWALIGYLPIFKHFHHIGHFPVVGVTAAARVPNARVRYGRLTLPFAARQVQKDAEPPERRIGLFAITRSERVEISTLL